MDRANEAAANDLAEVRKLIEGMNALVNSQQQQQQQAHELLQRQQEEQRLQQQKQLQQQQQLQEQQRLKQEQQLHQQRLQAQQQSDSTKQTNVSLPQNRQNNHTTSGLSDTTPSHSAKENTLNNKNASASVDQQQSQTTTAAVQTSGIIIEVNHLSFVRTLYFQLSPDATIEPLVAWLKISFGDHSVSGMVLQYKGFDGLWKCLLNRDDSLKRVLTQSLKNNAMLQMRVPREQDLLSSGYTDKRLLALTTRPDLVDPHAIAVKEENINKSANT